MSHGAKQTTQKQKVRRVECK